MNNLGGLVVVIIVITVLLIVGVLILRRKGSRQRCEFIDTGLKAIDLLVPIALGGDVSVSGEPHSGARVLGTELAYRLANLPLRAFRVIIYLDSALEDLEAVRAELHELKPPLQSIIVTSNVTTEDLRLRRGGVSVHGRDAVFAIGTSARFLHEFWQAMKAEREHSRVQTSLTTFSVTEGNVPEGFDVTMFSSGLLAREAIYPALDYRLSRSMTSLVSIPFRRRKVAESVRRSVNEVLEHLVPGAMNDPHWSFTSDPQKRIAVQLLRFLSQPYFVAEPYTGLKADFVPIDVMVKNFDMILRGKCSDMPLSNLSFQNALPEKQHHT